MMKKIGFFILSFLAISLFSMSFADVIPDNAHYVDRCVRFQNVEIDNYRVIVDINSLMSDWEVYEPQVGECLMQHYHVGETKQYLLDKSVDITEISPENIQDKAIQIGNLKVNGYYVDDTSPLSSEIITYKIVKNGDDYALEESNTETIESFENNEIIGDKEDINSLDHENVEDEYTKDETNYTLEIVETEQGIELASENRLIKFGIAWIITILIETIVLFAIAKICRKSWSIKNRKIIVTGILASTVTLPLLWFMFPIFFGNYRIYVIFGEILVTAIEVFIIKYSLKVERKMAIFASIICNLCSFLIGLFIF